MTEEMLLGALLALAAWLYYDGMRVREQALRAGRDYCRNVGLQLLDETVSRQRIGLARDGAGQVRIRRNYGFEFTSDGDRRYHGEITMLGMRVQGVQVELHRLLH
ncbi:MAG: DUF3301 domain-containing protein [Pseudomonadales bacterium]|jgi:hypothetical protein|nr:DUF3301 domain-containing protein [Pseudomonadales bacterium]MBP9033305.1 DUF3301 domain-containing protein [Pseudomonadales bacterium]